MHVANKPALSGRWLCLSDSPSFVFFAAQIPLMTCIYKEGAGTNHGSDSGAEAAKLPAVQPFNMSTRVTILLYRIAGMFDTQLRLFPRS